MIRAERDTDPIDGDLRKSGWRVALNGIADEIETETDDGRVTQRTTTYTNGRVYSRQKQSRAMIYRGIWIDKEYMPGDVVTWDGSLWHCEQPTTQKPGISADWKLAAKRGRDGKDRVK